MQLPTLLVKKIRKCELIGIKSVDFPKQEITSALGSAGTE